MNGLKDFRNLIKRDNKAFALNDIAPTVLQVGVAAMVGAVTLLVIVGMSNTGAGNTCFGTNTINTATGLCSAGTTYFSPAFNGLQNGISGIGNIFTQFPLMGTVIGLVLILGIVLYFFYGHEQGGHVGGL